MTHDHRLMVVEPEFASTFKVAGRETNTLSPVGHARRVTCQVDAGWEDRIMGGLSNGEGLIAQVCEREESETGE